MTIEVVTGLPGASKTLHTLARVKAWSEKDNRPVYYSGIKDLLLPWTEIDPAKWMECPPNSIIVIDECQTLYRPRSFGSNVPDYVAKLETHRHQGLDIVLITQHPLLIDTNVRRLAGKHLHIVRKFGTQSSTIHEWGSIKDNCDKPAGRIDSIKHHWKFDKEAFGFYKSAEVHTVKRNIPMKVWIFIAMPFLIGLIAWKFYDNQNKKLDATRQKPDQSQTQKAQPETRVAQVMSYAEAHIPEITGLPFTAPAYRDIMKASIAPKPVACASTPTRCNCYTQQGTKLPEVPVATCRSIVENGYFDDAPDKQQTDWRRQDQNAALLQAKQPPSRVGAYPEPERGGTTVLASAAPIPMSPFGGESAQPQQQGRAPSRK